MSSCKSWSLKDGILELLAGHLLLQNKVGEVRMGSWRYFLKLPILVHANQNFR